MLRTLAVGIAIAVAANTAAAAPTTRLPTVAPQARVLLVDDDEDEHEHGYRHWHRGWAYTVPWVSPAPVYNYEYHTYYGSSPTYYDPGYGYAYPPRYHRYPPRRYYRQYSSCRYYHCPCRYSCY